MTETYIFYKTSFTFPIFLFVLIIICFNKYFYKSCKFVFLHFKVGIKRHLYKTNKKKNKYFPLIKKYIKVKIKSGS